MAKDKHQPVHDNAIPSLENSHWIKECVNRTQKLTKWSDGPIKGRGELLFIALPRMLVKWTGTSSYLLKGKGNSRFADKDYLSLMSEDEKHATLSDLEDKARQYCSTTSFASQVKCMRSVVKACNIYEVSMMQANKKLKYQQSELLRAAGLFKRNKCDVYAPTVIEQKKTGFYCGYSDEEYRKNLVYCQDKSLAKNTCTINPLWPFLDISKQKINENGPIYIPFSNMIDTKKTKCKSVHLHVKGLIAHINSFNNPYDLRTYLHHQSIASSFYNHPRLNLKVRVATYRTMDLIDRDGYDVAAAWSYANMKADKLSFMSENALRSDHCYGLSTVSRPVASISSPSAVSAVFKDCNRHAENEFWETGAVHPILLIGIITSIVTLCSLVCVGIWRRRQDGLSSPNRQSTRPRTFGRSSSTDSLEDSATCSDVVSDASSSAAFLCDKPNKRAMDSAFSPSYGYNIY